jgi:hypothetical protein
MSDGGLVMAIGGGMDVEHRIGLGWCDAERRSVEPRVKRGDTNRAAN